MSRKYIVWIAAAVLAQSCGSDDSSDDSVTSASSDVGTLSLAYPGDLNIGSAMTGSSDTATTLAEVSTFSTPQTREEKQAILDSILNATSIDQCFNLSIGAIPQPECFAPNVQKSEIESAASSSNPFIITYDSSFSQLLYGDGGIVKTAETSGEACTAATVTYFTEDAVNFIEQGKQLFASIVCASKFASMELPAVGSTTDYLTALAEIPLPDGTTFDLASISREEVGGEDVYTTKLGVSFVVNNASQKLYAYFRHQPASTDGGISKGHVVVMQAGIDNSLASANNLRLQDNPPNDQGGNPPQQQSSTRTGVVSVAYETEGDAQNVILNRGNWQDFDADTESSKHPANLINDDGSFDYIGIAGIAADNSYADNFVNTKFQLGVSETNLGQGIIGWTASLSDGFWRSFAYTVESDGTTETAKSTFGFSEGYDSQGGTVSLPTAGKGMFCYWAQSFGSPLALQTDSYLESSGLSGDATNQVQYQVATRSDEGYFVHDGDSSKLSFKVASDCGGDTADNALADIDSSGNIDGQFTVPTIETFEALGGVDIDATEFDLVIE